MTRFRRHLTYANVAATLALVLAIGGGSAMALGGKNTVRSDEVKNGQITARDLAAVRAVTAAGSLSDPAKDGQVSYGSATARCRSSEQILGGGASNTPGDSPSSVVESKPVGNAWQVVIAADAGGTKPIAATALCLSAKPG